MHTHTESQEPRSARLRTKFGTRATRRMLPRPLAEQSCVVRRATQQRLGSTFQSVLGRRVDNLRFPALLGEEGGALSVRAPAPGEARASGYAGNPAALHIQQSGADVASGGGEKEK